MIRLLKTMVGENRSWDTKMKYTLWADWTTMKRIMGKALLQLVYGKICKLPISLQIPVYELLHQCSSNQEAMQMRIDKLVELDETRWADFNGLAIELKRVNGIFDRKTRRT